MDRRAAKAARDDDSNGLQKGAKMACEALIL
jgi:hypothetical protein